MIMRYVIVSTLFITAGLISTASAANFSCSPAVQNWQNGSQTTCPYDSNTSSPNPVEVQRVEVTPPPSEVDVSEEDTTVD
jgi:hypothetical protein